MNSRRILALRGVLGLSMFAFLGLSLQPAVSHAAPPNTGSMSGVVLDQFGDPVGGATVQLYVSQPGFIDYFAQTTADSNGQFSFRRLPAGDYSVVGMRLTLIEICFGSTTATVAPRQNTDVTVNVTCQ